MIDAHHHIWRQTDLPWLLGPERPRIFGAYAPIKRDYPIGEYLADIEGSGIGKSVYVQANWAPNWFGGRGRLGSRHVADQHRLAARGSSVSPTSRWTMCLPRTLAQA